MKLIDAVIYGYGKFEDMNITSVSPTIQVFYGNNEAGKSTLMSFIHSILFGFPTKQQQDLRYEPKTGIKYGGKLVVETTLFGRIVIERIQGKATGNVSVYFHDGTKGGEEALQQLFHGMDKDFYQAIYSFNIHGLQRIHTLKADDLGRYLFSSSLVGTDSLLHIEQKLTKQLDALFKPNGKRPLLNGQLTELKHDHEELLRWRDKNDRYKELIKKQELAQKELAELEETQANVQKELKLAEKMKNLAPLLQEKDNYLNELKHLPDYDPFPVDGVKRFEQLQTQLQPLEAQLHSLYEQRKELDAQYEEINVFTTLLAKEEEIKDIISYRRTYEANKKELIELSLNIQQKNDDSNRYRELLNIVIDEKEVIQFDTSILAKEKVVTFVRNSERLTQQKQFLDESFSRIQSELEESEEKKAGVERQLLDVQQKKDFEELQHKASSAKFSENEKRQLEESLKRVNVRIKAMKERQKSKQKNIVAFVLLFLATASWSVYMNEWIVAGITTFLFTVLLFFFRSIKAQSNILEEELNEEKEELIKRIQVVSDDTTNIDIQHIDKILLKDEQLRQLLEVEKVVYSQKERSFEKIVSQYEQWEQDFSDVNKQLAQFMYQYAMPTDFTGDRLLDFFQLLEKFKEVTNEKIKMIQKQTVIQDEVNDYEQRVKMLSRDFDITGSDISLILQNASKQLEEQQQKLSLKKELQRKIKETAEKITQLEHEVNHIKSECKKFLKNAHVNSEEEFRVKGNALAESIVIKQNLSFIKRQITRVTPYDEEKLEIDRIDQDYEQLIIEYSHHLEEQKNKEKQLQAKLSELSVEITQLEENGTYSEIHHKYEYKKSQLQESAKQWATYAVAKDILTKTVQQYRDVRLPKVVTVATEYFSFLTDQEYVAIFARSEKDSFIVERKDGVRFYPNELSQATAEQLYVSLRFALAEVLQDNVAYPIIIDDSFVNFDHNRMEQAIKLMRHISIKHQVLFFTCHDHLLKQFKEGEIKRLGYRTDPIRT